MRSIPAGATDVTIYVYLTNSSGAALTGELYTDMTGSYARNRAARSAITMATQTVTGAHSDGGFVEVDATNMPGIYRFDIPDAAFAAGVDDVTISLKSADSAGYNETISIDPSPVAGTATIQAAASAGATTINLPAGLTIRKGTVGVVYDGTGVHSSFVVQSYATPSATTLKTELTDALGTDSEVIFYSAPDDTTNYAVEAKVDTAQGEITQIKAKTDSLTFTGTSVQADIQAVDGAAISQGGSAPASAYGVT